MMSQKIGKFILLIGLCILCLQGCKSAGTSSVSSTTSRSNFNEATRTDVINLEVKAEMVTNKLFIKSLRLDEGEMNCRLISADGTVEWEETLSGARVYQQTFHLDDTVGTWTLEIELIDATGRYDIRWKASN